MTKTEALDVSRAVTHRLWLGGLCRSRKVGVLVTRIRDFGGAFEGASSSSSLPSSGHLVRAREDHAFDMAPTSLQLAPSAQRAVKRLSVPRIRPFHADPRDRETDPQQQQERRLQFLLPCEDRRRARRASLPCAALAVMTILSPKP